MYRQFVCRHKQRRLQGNQIAIDQNWSDRQAERIRLCQSFQMNADFKFNRLEFRVGHWFKWNGKWI